MAPVAAGHDRLTCALPGVAVRDDGAAGNGGCGVADTGALGVDEPPMFTAVTV